MVISHSDPSITLDTVLNSKESVIFERKGVFKPDGSIGLSPTKLANTIIGMLNAEGGTIILGVNNGEIQDLNALDSKKLNDYKQVILDMIAPPCNVSVEDIIIDGKRILIYHVETNPERIFCRKDNEEVYLRNGDETILLDRDWVRKLEFDKSIRKFEDEKREDFDPSDFQTSVLEFYKNKIHFEGSHDDLLVYRNLATKENGKYIYKNSAILLFAENPDKYIPSSSIRYVRYNGVKEATGTSLNVIKDERFDGCIARLIEMLSIFLKTIFKDYYFLDLFSGKFIKVPEYPEDAWLEGVVNALTHRSYNLQGNVIYIKHFDDRLEISNSGPLPSIVTVENIRETRFSRNPRIARVLIELGYVRELNEGVKRIYDSMEKYLLAKPEYINKNDIVTLILKNNIRNDNRVLTEQKRLLIERELGNLNESSKKIIMELSQNNLLPLEGLISAIGIGEKAVRQNLKKLISLGIVQKHSELQRDKNAQYSL